MSFQQALTKSPNTLSKEKAQEVPRLESTKRSLAKTISWRAVGTIDTILISWFITGTLQFAFSIGAIELVTKMILYFLHERTWNHITYGK